MKIDFKILLNRLHRGLADPAVASLGGREIKLRGYYFAPLFVLSWICFSDDSDTSTRSDIDDRSGATEDSFTPQITGGPRKGEIIDVSDFSPIAYWNSFTDEETQEEIRTPCLMHDPSTGYVFVVYNRVGDQAKFHVFYSKDGESLVPVKWSEKEVRVFKLMLDQG